MQNGSLTELLQNAPRIKLKPDRPVVILSDLHMGDGGKNDDFSRNGSLVQEALRTFYLPRGYTLILNGDTEELLRARRERIMQAWPGMYHLFDLFRSLDRLVWLKGNHEIIPGSDNTDQESYHDGEAVRLVQGQRTILVFHGHQAGKANSGRYNHLIGPALRIFANGLGIGNRSVAHNSEKQFRIEKRVYDFSREQGIMSVIGHTHRPLFESLSKAESLGYRIEALCREFSDADPSTQAHIRQTISTLKEAFLAKPAQRDSVHHLADTVYGHILTPCLFNAGCTIGKRGFTAMEIKNNKVNLVFWSSRKRTRTYAEYNSYKAPTLLGDDAFRVVLRRESLDYIFSRIELLR